MMDKRVASAPGFRWFLVAAVALALGSFSLACQSSLEMSPFLPH